MRYSSSIFESVPRFVFTLVALHALVMPSLALFYTNSRENDYPRIGKRVKVSDILSGVRLGSNSVPKYQGRILLLADDDLNGARTVLRTPVADDILRNQAMSPAELSGLETSHFNAGNQPDLLRDSLLLNMFRKMKRVQFSPSKSGLTGKGQPSLFRDLHIPNKGSLDTYGMDIDDGGEFQRYKYNYPADAGKSITLVLTS